MVSGHVSDVLGDQDADLESSQEDDFQAKRLTIQSLLCESMRERDSPGILCARQDPGSHLSAGKERYSGLLPSESYPAPNKPFFVQQITTTEEPFLTDNCINTQSSALQMSSTNQLNINNGFSTPTCFPHRITPKSPQIARVSFGKGIE